MKALTQKINRFTNTILDGRLTVTVSQEKSTKVNFPVFSKELTRSKSGGDDTAYLFSMVDDIVLTASLESLLLEIIRSITSGVCYDRSGEHKIIVIPVRLQLLLSLNWKVDGDPVLQVCLYMHDFGASLFGFKQILRYGSCGGGADTLDYGLQLFLLPLTELVAYADAIGLLSNYPEIDSGYCVFLATTYSRGTLRYASQKPMGTLEYFVGIRDRGLSLARLTTVCSSVSGELPEAIPCGCGQ
ncbi:hypothetical protein Tco_1059361, partial [Tanacetum coccineum]